jgi:hypothetical protein
LTAVGDNSTYVVYYDDGDNAWSAGLSQDLHGVLKTTNKYKREIVSVALGRNQGSSTYNTSQKPGDVYFVRRDTGTTYMGEQCSKQLREFWQEGEGMILLSRSLLHPAMAGLR